MAALPNCIHAMKTLLFVLQANPYNYGKEHFGKPYDSSAGVPLIFALIAIIIAMYIIIRVWLSFRKDKKNKIQNDDVFELQKKIQNTKKS